MKDLPNRPTRKTTEQAVAEMKAVHGDTYDYSLVEYVAGDKKVKIICPVHGVFEQTASNHIYGKGCRLCKYAKPSKLKLNTQTFVDQSNVVHGNKYDYTKSVYVTAKDKLIITCPIHGDFSCTPDNHKRGKGCPDCGTERTAEIRSIKEDEFLVRLHEKYGDRFRYVEGSWKGYNRFAKFVCEKHGEFSTRPRVFLQTTTTCPSCGFESKVEKRRYSHEEFVERARVVHGDKYDYPQEMSGIESKVEIICKTHGSFYQVLHNHLNAGAGCPSCNGRGFSNSEDGFVYLLLCGSGFKVGISHIPERRATLVGRSSGMDFEIDRLYFGLGADCLQTEKSLLEFFRKHYTSMSSNLKFDGCTESFYCDEEDTPFVKQQFSLIAGQKLKEHK